MAKSPIMVNMRSILQTAGQHATLLGISFLKPPHPPPSAADLFLEPRLLLLTQHVPWYPPCRMRMVVLGVEWGSHEFLQGRGHS